jgi:recombination DNA repair RAD52 pathway protein
MTDDDALKQALAELGDVVRCHCHEAFRDRGLHDPQCQCDSADAVKVVVARIEQLEREKREAALDALAAMGQAQEAYEAQLKAEARIEELEQEVERRIEPEQVEKLIEMAEPIMAELYAAECAYRKEAEALLDKAVVALQVLSCKCPSNCDWERDDVCTSWIARAVLAEIESSEAAPPYGLEGGKKDE